MPRKLPSELCHQNELSQRLTAAMKFFRLNLREVSEACNVAIPTIHRATRGKAIGYEAGKALEEWIEKNGEPHKCKHCDGIGYVASQATSSDHNKEPHDHKK